MKTKLIIEIETPDTHIVFPEEGDSEETWKGKEEELEKFRKEYAKGLHETIVKTIKKCNDNDNFQTMIIEGMEEYCVEDWYEFEDYGIKINLEE